MFSNLYSIYDNVAQIFNKPFTALNDGDAKRSFSQSLQQIPHKNDYVLYSVAGWNDLNGEIIPFTPTKIMSGFDVQIIEQPVPPASLRE